MTALIKKKAIAWCVCEVSPEVIDKINILNASFLAMTNAVRGLSITPEFLLIDGNRFRSELDIPFECIIKGDAKNGSIAAASILAKTYRDELMFKLHQIHPVYQWDKQCRLPNKGAPARNSKPWHNGTSSKKLSTTTRTTQTRHLVC